MVGDRRLRLNGPGYWLGLVAVLALLAFQGFALAHDHDDHDHDHGDEPCQICVVIAVDDPDGLLPIDHLFLDTGKLLTLEQAHPSTEILDLGQVHSARGPPAYL